MPTLKLVNRFRAVVQSAVAAGSAASTANVILDTTAGLPTGGNARLIVSSPVLGRRPTYKDTLYGWSGTGANTLANAVRQNGAALAVGDIVESVLDAETWDSITDGAGEYDIIVDSTSALESAFDAGNANKSILVKRGTYTAGAPNTPLTIPSGSRVYFDRVEFSNYLIKTTEQHCTGQIVTGGRYVYTTSFTTTFPRRLTLDTTLSSVALTALPAMPTPGDWYVGVNGRLYNVESRDSDTQLTLTTGPNRIDLASSVNRVFSLYKTPPTGIRLSGDLSMRWDTDGDATIPAFNFAGSGHDLGGLTLRLEYSRGWRRSTILAYFHVIDSVIGRVVIRPPTGLTFDGAWTSNHRCFHAGHCVNAVFQGVEVNDIRFQWTLNPGETAFPQLAEFIACQEIDATVRLGWAKATRTGGTAANLLGLNYTSTLYSVFRGSVGQMVADTVQKTNATVPATGTDVSMVRLD